MNINFSSHGSASLNLINTETQQPLLPHLEPANESNSLPIPGISPSLHPVSPTSIPNVDPLLVQQKPKVPSIFDIKPLELDFLKIVGLVYKSPDPHIVYSATPPGYLDFSQGELQFASPGEATTWKKCSLVLFPFTLASRSAYLDYYLFEELMRYLLDHEFKIYYFLNDKLHKLEFKEGQNPLLKFYEYSEDFLSDKSKNNKIELLKHKKELEFNKLKPVQTLLINNDDILSFTSQFCSKNFYKNKIIFPNTIYEFDSGFIRFNRFLNSTKIQEDLFLNIDLSKEVINKEEFITHLKLCGVENIILSITGSLQSIKEFLEYMDVPEFNLEALIINLITKKMREEIDISFLKSYPNLQLIMAPSNHVLDGFDKLNLRKNQELSEEKILKIIHDLPGIVRGNNFYHFNICFLSPLNLSTYEKIKKFLYNNSENKALEFFFINHDGEFSSNHIYGRFTYTDAHLSVRTLECLREVFPTENVSISLDPIFRYADEEKVDESALTKLFLDFFSIISSKLKNLEIYTLSNKLSLNIFISFANIYFPNLTSLTINGDCLVLPQSKPHPLCLYSFLKACPNLKNLHINYENSVEFYEDLFKKDLFLNSLTTLDVRAKKNNINEKQFIQLLLTKMPNLQELFLRSNCGYTLEGSSHSSLHTLVAAPFPKMSEAFPKMRNLFCIGKIVDPSHEIGLNCSYYLDKYRAQNLDQNGGLNCFSLNEGNILSHFTTQRVFRKTATNYHRSSLKKVYWHSGHVAEINIPAKISVTTLSSILSPISRAERKEYRFDQAFFSEYVSTEWTLLPGIAYSDRFQSIEAVGKNSNLDNYEFGYDSLVNQTYIRSRSSLRSKLNLKYVLAYRTDKLPDVKFDLNQSLDILFSSEKVVLGSMWAGFQLNILSTFASYWRGYTNYSSGSREEVLAKLVMFFKSFSVGAPKFRKEAAEFEVVNAVLEQKTGAACSGRSQLFCIILKEIIPEAQVNLISNGPHAFVEVGLQNKYYLICLGGYPSDIDEKPIDENDFKEVKCEPASKLLRDNQARSRGARTSKGISVNSEDLASFTSYAQCISRALDAQTNKQALLLLSADQFVFCNQAFIREMQIKGEAVVYMDIQRRSLVEFTNDQEGKPQFTPNKLHEVVTRGGLILLDLTSLSPSNIAALCQMTDPANRTLQGVKLSPDTKVVALLPKEYPFSADMGRRFALIDSVSSSLKTLPLTYKHFPFTRDFPPNSVRIPLYEDAFNWSSELVSSVEPSLKLLPGKLVQACQAGLPVVLEDLPQTTEFNAFLEQLEGGSIRFNGQNNPLPEDLKIYYDYCEKPLRLLEVAPPDVSVDAILNKYTFYQFFPNWLVSETGFAKPEGLLKSFENSEKVIQLSGELTELQWLKLLKTAEAHQVKLKFIIPHSVTLPDFLQAERTSVGLNKHAPALFLTEDPGLMVHQLKQAHHDAIIIHVTLDMRVNDIMPTYKRDLDKKFYFVEGDIWKALLQERTVILTGTPSAILIQELASMLALKNPQIYLKGEFISVPGRLLIVSDNKELAGLLPTGKMTEMLKGALSAYPEGRIRFAEDLLKLKKVTPSYTNISQMLKYVDGGCKNPQDLFSVNESRPLNISERDGAVMSAWSVTPILYLIGPPASGKTYFMTDTLPAILPGHKFYHSITQIKAFLESKDEAVLCIDEGDMHPKLWETLEGLLLDEPTVLFENTLYRNLRHLRIVITGNAGFCERKTLGFVERSGGVLCFEPLPEWMIKDKIAKPLSHPRITDEFTDSIMQSFKAALKEKLDIDIRDLKTLCALSHVYMAHFDHLSAQEMAAYAFLDFYPEFKGLAKYKEAHQNLVCQEVKKWLSTREWNPHFILTATREVLLWKLICQVELRERQIPGAQNGMLITGDAGEGKTALVESFVKASGLKYERIDLTEDPEIVRSKMQRCFHAGLIVIVDEFDGFYEEEWNAYLTGRDLRQKPAENKGFMLFATANDGYNYRLPLFAVLSRLWKTKIYSQPIVELIHTVQTIGVESEQAAILVDDHIQARAHSSHEALRPTPADLFAQARASLSL